MDELRQDRISLLPSRIWLSPTHSKGEETLNKCTEETVLRET